MPCTYDTLRDTRTTLDTIALALATDPALVAVELPAADPAVRPLLGPLATALRPTLVDTAAGPLWVARRGDVVRMVLDSGEAR